MPSVNPLTLVAAILLPPLALFLTRGITPAFWLSIVLTLIGYLPGMIFGLAAVFFPRQIPIR
ncbi:Uncharacterized membrane protein YqaE, homolog of Blt101, UPF0057 family [Sphingomonas sp. YR710]|jgi:uncharacterized membrane protein YqaE (UPF0057 family)|uniref:YqaE/Pmp3 family membrane protein n=1 Tax=Sphingomonas sp. YR710 TaxID=1882773 RepID=UPI00088CEF19|nr:YqaE/Pmp3 family membrane protein [Sphingomonas sp. YR710]SDD02167.1 Uncharacterized membrane protein YqaE, homolog of Blt101, UPF0057 family [Sphingomonas sp. YR710]